MIRQYELVEKIKYYDPAADEAAINRAYVFAMKAHGTQTRANGDPYFTHPLEVANILTSFRLDSASIITALLHDTLEDTEVTLEEITGKFGSEVAKLVDGVTKLNQLEEKSESIKQAENFRKLVVAMSDDIRVLLVKLADRLHNMRTLHFIKKPEKRQRIARETLDIYAPLAERIGMRHIREELQDLAFGEIYPEVRQSIINRLSYLRQEGKSLVDGIIGEMSQLLLKHNLTAEVSGREKSPYSIWVKMQTKNLGFEQLSDIMAFRILVADIPSCYQALGIIHSSYHMVPDRFKDYISTPKGNGYKSIHTTIMGPENHRIEFQIRTYEMHEFAEVGVASHWSYKEGASAQVDGKQYRWIRELLELLESSSNPEEFLENTKMDLYHDQVFCFTPKGDLISLQRGATPVDFAYAIHSSVGNTCIGAKINGRIEPLKTQLHNGDQVEIIRSKTAQPSPAWERVVVTPKAKAEIRKFVRGQQREQFLNLGRGILEKTFADEGKEFVEKNLEPALKKLGKKTAEDLIAEVGEGILSRQAVFEALYPDHFKTKRTAEKLKNVLTKPLKKKKEPARKGSIPIKGLIPGMAVHLANCCHPLPGDRIVGIVSSGKGVAIHNLDCDLLEKFTETPERWIDVSWDSIDTDKKFIGRLKAVVSHSTGALADIANSIAKSDGNISNLKIVNRSTDFFEILLDVEVKNSNHLMNVMSALRARSMVHSIERYSS